jgi:hypothetical protein
MSVISEKSFPQISWVYGLWSGFMSYSRIDRIGGGPDWSSPKTSVLLHRNTDLSQSKALYPLWLEGKNRESGIPLRVVIPSNHQGSQQLALSIAIEECAFCNYLTCSWKPFAGKTPSKLRAIGENLGKAG